ncbi:MAG: CRISPR-associated helicase Cas3' [Candidatus Thermoplasmatota archaeon]
MSFSSELLSHPETLLKDHLKETMNIAEEIISSKNFGKDFQELAKIIAGCHDFGKSTTFFQNYIRNLEDSVYNKPIKNHSRISAAFTYYIIQKNLDLDDSLYPIIGWYVVLKHHGNLADLSREEIIEQWTGGNNYQIMKKQVEDIKDNFKKVCDLYENFDFHVDLDGFLEGMLSEEKDIFREIKKNAFDLGIQIEELDYFMDALFLYSVLQEADKFSSAGIRYPKRKKVPSSDIVTKYIENVVRPKDKEINRLRDKASTYIMDKIDDVDVSKNRVFSITLPTGLGKTLSAFRVALKLRGRINDEFGITPRLIYSLPFLSIIEQNYDTIEKVLQLGIEDMSPEILLKHHFLSKGFSKKEDKRNPISDLLLTESWQSEIIITTFIQLFESMITNKKNRARKFHNITNSIIILDEIQSIPRKYWKLINNFLCKLAYRYECWIIFMTATQPLIFEPDEITELVDDKEIFFSTLDRIEYNDEREIEDIDELKDRILSVFGESNKDILAVMNTKGSAEELFKKLGEDVDVEKNLIFLSTNLLPQDRLNKIKRIKKSKNQKIVVSTQLIEAGVDIDLDVVFRDFAPFDSIVQAAGRCNRENSKEKGEVSIVKLVDDRYDGSMVDYSRYIYDSSLLNCTDKSLDDLQSFSEKDFNFHGVKNYYRILNSRGSDRDSEEILNYIKNLKFSKAREFKLISKNYEEVSVFVEKDKDAVKIRRKVEEICDSNFGYIRKAKMLSMKNEFYKNIIDLRVKDEEMREKIAALPTVKGMETLYLVERERIDRWYDEHTGFKLPISTFEDRFL